jgi:hypothetical protein
MRRPRTRLVLGITIPLLVVGLLLAAWALDSSSADGKVPRNVVLAGRDISKAREDALAATVADIAEEYAAAEVEIRTPGRTYEVPAGELGLALDQKATVRAALDLDRDRPLVLRPLLWLASFLDERQADLVFTLDEQQLELTFATLAGNSSATEPSVVPTPDGFSIVSGSPGTAIRAAGVGDQLLERATSGVLPLVVSTTTEQQRPSVSDEAARRWRNPHGQHRRGPGHHRRRCHRDRPGADRPLLGELAIDGDAIVATLDAERAVADVTAALPAETRGRRTRRSPWRVARCASSRASRNPMLRRRHSVTSARGHHRWWRCGGDRPRGR